MKGVAIHWVALAAFVVPLSGQHQTAVLDEPVVGGVLPYQIDIREISIAPAALPQLHSVASAVWGGRWVLFAGRTSGLHGMTGRNAFDPVAENREVWVIDPASRESWRKSLEISPASGLDRDEVDSLSAVNSQFFQDGSTLWVVGGYGYRRSIADHHTYASLTAIDLPGLVGWVTSPAGTENSMAADHIRQLSNPFFKVTGGALERLGPEFQLVFGQDYEGRYRPNRNGVYTQRVRRFTAERTGEGITVPTMLETRADAAFRRRDLNVLPILEPAAVPGEHRDGVAVLSGVFTPEGGVWTVPVVIGAGGALQMPDPMAADTLRQAFQVYHCAKAALYHRASGELHALLFGGITVLEYDRDRGEWSRDDNAPFTNQCGVVVRGRDGRFRQFWLPARFPRILQDGKELRFGTNAEFFPAPDVPKITERILDLAALTEPTVIGHVFGGIVADAGNGGNTGASGRIFEVLLTPVLPHPFELSVSAAGDGLRLHWWGEPGTAYVVEESRDLKRWFAVSATLEGRGAELEWPAPQSGGRHFYRVLAGTISGSG